MPSAHLIEVAVNEPDVELFGLEVVRQLLAVGLLRHEHQNRACPKKIKF
jgi:hypothetical protein